VNVVNGVAKVPALRWNDFGGTIGGPIYIPGHYNKDRNKTFFFFSEEARRIITYTTFQPIMPTTAMLAGTFPTPVCISGGATCTATSTQITAAQINPISAEYIKDISVSCRSMPPAPRPDSFRREIYITAVRRSFASTTL
jgi:hypothetical protein